MLCGNFLCESCIIHLRVSGVNFLITIVDSCRVFDKSLAVLNDICLYFISLVIIYDVARKFMNTCLVLIHYLPKSLIYRLRICGGGAEGVFSATQEVPY